MKLKKIVAALCAAAMTASAIAITPLFASAEGTVWDTVSDGVYKLADKDAEDKTLYLDLTDVTSAEIAASVRSISVDVDGTGSNGCIGTNAITDDGEATWTSAGWADSQTVTIETPNGIEFNTETGYGFLQVQVWWCAGDITVSNICYDIPENEVWETVSDGVYKLVDKDAEDKTLYLDLLDANTPELAASIRNIVVNVDGAGSNGCIGTNVMDESGAAVWASAGWTDSQEVTLETPNGVEFNTERGCATMQVQVWWVGGDITVDYVDYFYEGEDPNGGDDDNGDTIVIWEGSKDLGTDWGANVRTSVAEDKVKAGDTVKITYEVGSAAEYQQIKLMSGADGWPVLTSVATSEWGTVDLAADSTSFTFVINADDVAAIVANNIIISGYNVTIKSIEVIPVKTETEEPTTPETPAAPAVNPLAGNCTIMPVYSINLVASDNAAAIKQLKEGDVYEYQLSDVNPVIKRRVFRSIMGKDITIKVTYRGMIWEYNGKDITEPHTVNFKKLYEAANAE